MKRRVAVTGMGIVSSVGCTVEKFWRSIAHGVSGVKSISQYNAGGLPVSIAGEVKDFCCNGKFEKLYRFNETLSIPYDRRTQFAISATEQALKGAGLDENMLAEANLYLGAGEGQNCVELISKLLDPFINDENSCDELSLFTSKNAGEFAIHDQMMEATIPASLIAKRYGICGEVTTSLTACAASGQAIGEAMLRVQSGECSIALAGGTHTMTGALDVIGFSKLSALSKSFDQPEKASRPFDLNRNGFVLGEGAGMLILEEFEQAKKRGATIYAEIIGYGASSDAYRVTDMHPEAIGAVAAIESALNSAGIEPKEIGYVNAHGTSTLENDRSETKALHKSLGKFAPEIPVSSVKSMTGHAVAAAGVIEMIASILALSEQVLPPTINLETPDPECDLDYVPNSARAKSLDVALSNSFGFGGQNVALLVRKGEVNNFISV